MADRFDTQLIELGITLTEKQKYSSIGIMNYSLNGIR